ncbi:MAG: STAS domain-containing protein [Thermanaeromonas sp.]|uniref:STAS domain-containing protein n=1 Tax=Thermanaeromonas sp. TaxID=2003697 RepID=UPI002437B9BF|nr:STAS domain-containing protein [Thermanaeromonas sp.]MCG0279095.1 STAS domain-containing protein [Thermanaeromonas sp.]
MTNPNKFEEIASKLGATARETELWKQLMEVSVAARGEEEKQVLTEVLRSLIGELGENQVAEKVTQIANELPEYPVVKVMQYIIQVSASLRREQEHTLSQLRQMLSELATPIIRIWTDMLLVAMIGNIDSQRAQDIAERLLNRVSSARAKVVIVDVTGVPMIDTVVGGFLIEMFNAIKLLGAEVILTGIKPEVAHTLVKLGVDFRMVSIARDLEDALRRGIAITMEESKKRRQLALSLAGSGSRESGEGDVF